MSKTNVPALSARDIQAAQMILKGKMTLTDISEALGVSTKWLQRRRATPVFRRYLDEQQAKDLQIIEAPEDKELAKFAKKLGGRAEVLALLWDWANIEPGLTKYNIESQRRALEDYRSMLGMKSIDPLAADLPESPDVYQAEWMRDRQPN